MTVRLAILGANGQIGSELVRELGRYSDLKIVAVCRNAVGAAQIENAACDTRIGRLTTPRTAADLLSDCDVIINCIWPAGPPKEARRENEDIVRSLAGIGGNRKVVLLSSVAVHGYCIDATRSTFERPRPDSLYGRHKRALERFALRAFKTSTAQLYIVRLGHVYGAHQWLSQEIVTLLESGTFLIPFGGMRASNAIHVSEVAAAFAALARSSKTSGIYNLSALPQRNWRELFDWHAEVCGLDPPQSLDAEASERWRAHFLRTLRRLTLTTALLFATRWLKTLPYPALVTSNEFRTLLGPAVSFLPSTVQNRLKASAAVLAVRTQLQRITKVTSQPSPWHCSDAMPGPHLEVPPSEAYVHRQGEELLVWYRAKSLPPRFAA